MLRMTNVGFAISRVFYWLLSTVYCLLKKTWHPPGRGARQRGLPAGAAGGKAMKLLARLFLTFVLLASAATPAAFAQTRPRRVGSEPATTTRTPAPTTPPARQPTLG